MTDLVDEKLGPAEAKLSFIEGKLVVEVDYAQGAVSAGVVVKLDPVIVLDALKHAIPGDIDDAVINGVEALLKNLPRA